MMQGSQYGVTDNSKSIRNFAGPFFWGCYKPNREPTLIRRPNVQLAVFKKKFFSLTGGT
jgi:hypothetical protein